MEKNWKWIRLLFHTAEKNGEKLGQKHINEWFKRKQHESLSRHQVSVSWSHFSILILICKIVVVFVFCVARHFEFKTGFLSVISLSKKRYSLSNFHCLFLHLVEITVEEWNWSEKSFRFLESIVELVSFRPMWCYFKLTVQTGNCMAYLWLLGNDLSVSDFNLQWMEYANKPDFRLIPVKTFLEKLRLILIKTSGDKISLLRTERLIYIDDDLIRSLPIL